MKTASHAPCPHITNCSLRWQPVSFKRNFRIQPIDLRIDMTASGTPIVCCHHPIEHLIGEDRREKRSPSWGSEIGGRLDARRLMPKLTMSHMHLHRMECKEPGSGTTARRHRIRNIPGVGFMSNLRTPHLPCGKPVICILGITSLVTRRVPSPGDGHWKHNTGLAISGGPAIVDRPPDCRWTPR